MGRWRRYHGRGVTNCHTVFWRLRRPNHSATPSDSEAFTGNCVCAGNFAAGELTDERIQTADTQARNFATVDGVDDTSTFWAVEGGIEKKFFDLGKTTLFAQYYDHDGGASARMALSGADPINPFAVNSRIWSTGVEMVGAGVVQEIRRRRCCSTPTTATTRLTSRC